MKPRSHGRILRPGFTLIELLVVIAMIAILVSLLLPAVQQAREAARRTQCRHNLAQLGVALHSYQLAWETLPPGTIDNTGPVTYAPDRYQMSWIVQLLPMMGQDNVFRHIDFDSGAYSPANAAVRAVRLELLTCPSDYGMRVNHPDLGEVYRTSYAASHSGDAVPIDENNNGVMFLNKGVNYREIHDGESNTIMLGEVLTLSLPDVENAGWMSGTAATLCHTEPGRHDPYRLRRSEAPVTQQSLPSSPLSSMHQGGFYCLLADGAVQFLSQNISEEVLSNLGNRNDGALHYDW